jgi:olefin beta-lactone synthetase
VNIAALLAEQARERPDAAAIIERCGTTTFAQLDLRARRAAAMLRHADIGPGDAVLIFQPMSAELYTALLAVFRLGATAMFLDPSAGRAHIEACCALQPPRALIASSRAHLLLLFSRSLRRIPRKFAIGCWVPGATRWRKLERFASAEDVFSAQVETPALLTFTSGSTGQPKAAVRTHGFLIEQHRVLSRSIALEPGEVDLATLPIFTLANLATGVTSVIPDADLRRPGAIVPAPVLRQIREHRITRCAASPAFFERLLAGNDGTLERMRKVFTGGAPVFPSLLSALRNAAPQARVEAVFGSTEAEPIAHIEEREISESDRTAMLSGRGLLTGHPVPEIQLRILSDRWGQPLGSLTPEEFSRACLPPGEAGEIVVSGGHVLPGYLRGRGDEETKFRVDGTVWHRTGDAGWLDPMGRLWLLGRCSAKITSDGGVLWPFAVECAAMNVVGVQRAALAEVRGRRLLVLQTSGDAATVCTNAREQLSWAKFDEVRPVSRIPLDKRHNAKIDYPALRRMLES